MLKTKEIIEWSKEKKTQTFYKGGGNTDKSRQKII